MTGFPKFSYFNSKIIDSCGTYIHAINCNKISTHTNFNVENIKYEPEEISNNYKINLTELLGNGKYSLIGGLQIYLHKVIDCDYVNMHNACEIIKNIKLNIDDVYFEYDYIKLLLNNKMFQTSEIYINRNLNYTSFLLPIELFEQKDTWINIENNVPVILKLEFKEDIKIRIDFRVVNLDTEEKRRINFNINKNTTSMIDKPIRRF